MPSRLRICQSRRVHLWLAVSLLLLPHRALFAQTYDLQVYGGFDAGWSMDGGTIMTNGFLGSIDETSNIGALFIDWSIGFTSPQGSYEFTPANSVFTAVDTITIRSDAVVDVDPQSIDVLFDAFGVDLLLSSDTGQSLLWDGPRFQQIPLCCVITEFGSVRLSDSGLSSTVSLGSCEEGFDVGCTRPDGLRVAVVPEPASWLFVLIGIAGWIRAFKARLRVG